MSIYRCVFGRAEKMKTVDTFTAQISVGFKNIDTGVEYSARHAKEICQDYCDEVGLCVTVAETEFIYTGGSERGCIVGLINYPRFPSTPEKILGHAFVLAKKLLDEYHQHKVSIICPDKTYMIERSE